MRPIIDLLSGSMIGRIAIRQLADMSPIIESERIRHDEMSCDRIWIGRGAGVTRSDSDRLGS
eukprot:5793117-Pyramimonas_sp.AAC.1